MKKDILTVISVLALQLAHSYVHDGWSLTIDWKLKQLKEIRIVIIHLALCWHGERILIGVALSRFWVLFFFLSLFLSSA